MVGALWTGISGLGGSQIGLDNESNNIANVNTIGYKSSRVSFADQMYQDRIGKGVTSFDVEKMYTQGNLKITGVSYDMALSGDGFFQVKDGADTYYTRAGNFRMGEGGTLEDVGQNKVQGWAIQPLTPDDITSTDPNATFFTNDFSKLLGNKIIKDTTTIETIATKATDYTTTATTDSNTIFSGAGYKTASTKIGDIEALITEYNSALSIYAEADPKPTASSSSTQKDFLNYGLSSSSLAEGDEIYVYVDGVKYSQTFDTDQETTIKKFVDKLSDTVGFNAYLTNDASSPYEMEVTDTNSAGFDNGYIVLESLIPGQQKRITELGWTDASNSNLASKGILVNVQQSVLGTGMGHISSIEDALSEAVSGKQTDVYQVGGSDNMIFDTTAEIQTINLADSIAAAGGGDLIVTLTDSTGSTFPVAVTLANNDDQATITSKIETALLNNPNTSTMVDTVTYNAGVMTINYTAGAKDVGVVAINEAAVTSTGGGALFGGAATPTAFDASNNDFTYQIEIYDKTTDTTVKAPTSPLALDDIADLDELVANINNPDYPVANANNLPDYVKAYNINGNLVVKTLDSNYDVEFTGNLVGNKNQITSEVQTVTINNTVAAGTGGGTLVATVNDIDYEIYVTEADSAADITERLVNTIGTSDPGIVSIDYTSGNTSFIINYSEDAGDVAAVAFADKSGDPVLWDDGAAGSESTATTVADGDLTFTTTTPYDAYTYSQDEQLARDPNYSGREGAGAEFLKIGTTINQTASKSELQLRLDTLGITDNAFGDFEVDETGVITMTQDGTRYAIGQVAVARFTDNRGLEPVGDNLLMETTRSGTALFNIDNDKMAEIKGGSLELSTADLSESLVNLMVFQRAFEANAKSITTADTILNTLIQLKR